jgi:DNA-binding transcriptional regulator YdaS (Cro superfamily)
MITEDAVLYFKGKSKLAKALSISPAAVSQWGAKVPKLRQFELERLTQGRLRAASSEQLESVAA